MNHIVYVHPECLKAFTEWRVNGETKPPMFLQHGVRVVTQTSGGWIPLPISDEDWWRLMDNFDNYLIQKDGHGV